MKCCPDQITYFTNKSTTDIPYEGQFGLAPTVTVLYLIDGVWQAKAMTQVELQYSSITQSINTHSLPIPAPVNSNTVSNIHIDHGGPATGIVRLS